MYKPLPSSLVIQSSSVDGQGLFAKQDIPARENLGVTHIKLGEKIIEHLLEVLLIILIILTVLKVIL